MSELRAAKGSIRKLWPAESAMLRDHLLRLDKASRRMRFAHGVSDAFIVDYADRMSEMSGIVHAYIEDGEARAVAELRKLADVWGREAEAALSVEPTHQNVGVGTALMGRIIRSARNRGVQRLYMSCLAENARMQRIARRFDAELTFEHGDVLGEIIPTGADYFSLVSEELEDSVGYMLAVLDLHSRLARAA